MEERAGLLILSSMLGLIGSYANNINAIKCICKLYMNITIYSVIQ